jgi:hypothetical protein
MSASSHLVHLTNVLSTYPIISITRNAGFTGSVAFSTTGLPRRWSSASPQLDDRQHDQRDHPQHRGNA